MFVKENWKYLLNEFCMLVFARDSNHKNNADPGCSGVLGFPYS